MKIHLFQSLQRQFANDKILILGFGREGQSTYRLLREVFPDKDLFISDQKKINLLPLHDSRLYFDAHYLDELSKYAVIFKTPGIPFNLPQLTQFIYQNGRVTSQLQEFLKVYSQHTIGITGTKGKSTTSSLIYHVLKEKGIHTLLVGNIGKPLFDFVHEIQQDSQVVCEMSSYQLENVTNSPHIAVLLNLFQEHLNYHGTFENYAEAKAKITLFQSERDIFIYNQDQIDAQLIAEKTEAQKKGFSAEDAYFGQLLEKYSADIAHLPKTVQKQNLLPAFLVVNELGVSEKEFFQAVKTFQPLPHRLQKLGTYNGVTFVDDTLATIPEATAASIEACPKVDVIILGGYDRGIQYQKVVDKVMEKKIPTVLLFKPSGEKMVELFQEKYGAKIRQEHLPRLQFVETMEEAIRFAYQYAPKDGVVLLSPSSPSYGQFKDYEDKSAQFLYWIEKLAHAQS